MAEQSLQTNPDPDSNDIDDAATISIRKRFLLRMQAIQFYAYTTLIVLLLALGFLWPRIFINGPAGHHAVMYRMFAGGTVTNRVWDEGLKIIPPWDSLTVYETRLQTKTIEFTVLSEEGLNLEVKVSVRYRPNKEMIGFLK